MLGESTHSAELNAAKSSEKESQLPFNMCFTNLETIWGSKIEEQVSRTGPDSTNRTRRFDPSRPMRGRVVFAD